jgi:hypothetical protein
MDADLKARLVSTEELSLAVNSHLRKVQYRAPVAWWDRSCDIALLIGTFVHGLGNYEAMQNDDALPFAFNIRTFAQSDQACAAAQKQFYCAAKAARSVFDSALEAAKIKDQLQIQAAVAAAAAASMEREKDALALREGGAAADAVISNMHEQPADKLYETDGDDSHFVTLLRLKSALCLSLRNDQATLSSEMDVDLPAEVTSKEGDKITEETSSRRRGGTQQPLAMPDARVLDYRLNVLLSEIECNAYPDEAAEMKIDKISHTPVVWPSSEIVSTNNKIRTRALSYVTGVATEDLGEHICEYMGIGINGTQCGSSHRSLDDSSDFSMGAASSDLAQVAYGSDSPRYLRAIGVPMNLTRFALSALIHADDNCVESLLSDERIRNHVDDEKSVDETAIIKKEGDETPATIKKEGEETPAAAESEKQEITETPNNAVKSEENKELRIPKPFDENAVLRSSVCAVVLHYGFPFKSDPDSKVYKSLWSSIREQCGTFDDAPPDALFQPERFLSLVKGIAGDVDLPDFDTIKAYVESCLLPHCLRLCVMGNGPSLGNARGSKGEYETAYGISVYPEHTEDQQCLLPDPCLPLAEHSVEALATANAILRRTRLMRTALEIANGKLSLNELDEVLHSSFLRKSMEGLPVWWCPWIHDAALLVHASTRGLFSILKDRHSDENPPLAFCRKTILQHMYSTFVADETNLPRSIVDESAPEDSQIWIEHQSKDFPSANVLERRLAFVCAKATEKLDDDEERYANLPMFDHGAWPRN